MIQFQLNSLINLFMNNDNSLPLVVYDSSPEADSPFPPSTVSDTEYSFGTIINKNMYTCLCTCVHVHKNVQRSTGALFTTFNSTAHQQQNG